MKCDCIIAGVGGQGNIFIARLIGNTALQCGFKVRGSETIGMAQRGGSVVSHVRLGREIYSPLIPMGKADVVIAMEPAEAVPLVSFLREGGTMVVSDRPVWSATGDHYDLSTVLSYLHEQKKIHMHILNGKKIVDSFGAKSLNTALLGAAAATGGFPFSYEMLLESLSSFGAVQFRDSNKKALQIGAKMIDAERQCGGK